ncbi:MAG: carbonic anhydrase [Methylophilaceae bacterium]
MNKIIMIALLFFALVTNSYAANWVKLQEDKDSKLMLDKQSVLEVDKLKRAWVKIVYKKPQVNVEVAEKTYNLSKLLWFFDCKSQKSATSQVFQLSDDELIYSAAVDSSAAKFIEPVPETEIDVAMRYVCEINKPEALEPEKKEAAPLKKEVAKDEKVVEKPAEKPIAKSSAKPEVKPEMDKAKVVSTLVSNAEKSMKLNIKPIVIPKPNVANKAHWGYEGDEGPENWAKLSPDYSICATGSNQSPINIDKTIDAELKPLKVFQRFPASDIVNNGHTVQVNFKPGNILALDGVLYQMKQVHFHAPSENTIHGKSFPLEAHFVHVDVKGKLAVLAVMFEEGKANEALGRLWQQIPANEGAPVILKSRVLPSDMVSQTKEYFRFGGSLTTPPCSEGVSWVLLKTPMTASAAQIEAIKKVFGHQNNRPVQELNSRLVVE